MQTEFHSGLPGHRVFSPVHISISIGTAPRTLASIGPDKEFHTSRRVRAASTWKLEKHSAPGPLKLPRTRRCFFLTWTKKYVSRALVHSIFPVFFFGCFCLAGSAKKKNGIMADRVCTGVYMYMCACTRSRGVLGSDLFWIPSGWHDVA